MSPPKDGGPAFPLTASVQAALMNPGMSLRDWFAGKALPKCLEETWGEGDGAESAAIGAYQIADAMLAEREKGGGA